MIRTYFIFLLVAGMFGAMLSNCGGTRGARSASEPNAFDREKAYQADVLANGYKEKDNSYAGQDVVELRREPDGHFYADVEINNMPVHILVDTGASGIALSREDARRAGLATSIGMYEVVGEGAGGDVRGEYVTLNSVRLGKVTAKQDAGRHPRRRREVAARPELPAPVRQRRDQGRHDGPALERKPRRFSALPDWSSRAGC